MSGQPVIGLAGVGVLLLLLLSGMPIGVALGIAGLGGLVLVLGLEPAIIKSGVLVFETMTRYELGTLPLFMLMAHLCFAGGASRDFFTLASKLFGHRRGGLAIASVAGCAGFGSINGSSLATTATMGLVAVPEMRERNYSNALATGSVAAGGTLGQMIPPSGALIVFGIIAEQSIGTLFTAAIIPGLTQMLSYFLVIALLVRWRPEIAPSTGRASWAERHAALRGVVDIGILVLVVTGGIVIGWITPSEAAAVGAAGALLICFRRGKLTRQSLRRAVEDTLRTSGL
ncbi:MAG: TRAP transporter large permease subunit, partial [Gammaproteobacteria bacterium]